MANSMVSEVAGALDEGTADEIIVVYADTKVQHVDRFNRGDIVTCGRYSGGGTDFRNSFEWMAKNEPDASCAIYLTDMGTCHFGEEPPCPVLWAVYANETEFDQLAQSAPFGEAIHVDNVVW
jgi:predicted metal-dependent peptidase